MGMNIAVYLGASEGNDPSLREHARQLGQWIGRSGNNLVYGGSKCGLMGAVAQAALEAGAEVTGVEPQFFVDQGLVYEQATRLIVTPDMQTRRAKMMELSQAFIAFPGGSGTLEEISEVMSKTSLNHLYAPCIVYNLDGYYDELQALLAKMIEKGFSTTERQRCIRFATSLDEVADIIENWK